MYYMFLDTMQVPIPPEKMRTRIRNKNYTVNLLNGDEINIIKSPGLTDIEFEIILPNSSYPFNQSILQKSVQAQIYLDKLQELKQGGDPFQFIMVRMKDSGEFLNLENIKVTLEEYSLNEDAREPYDFYADIRLKQYRDYTTKTITVTTDASGTQTGTTETPRSTTGKTALTSVTAKSGDTLQTLIKKNFGTVSAVASMANSISFVQKLNKLAVPAALAVGQVIKIREDSSDGTNTQY